LGFIPDGSAPAGTFGSPRDVTFPVTGFGTGTPTRVGVTIAAQHTWVGDLDIALIAPNGTSRTILSRTGATAGNTPGDGSSLDGTYTFSDIAPTSPTWWGQASARPDNKALFSGFYRASSAGPGAGGGTNTSITTGFTGIPAMNGTWTLRVRDGNAGSIGEITGASLDLVGPVAATPASLGAIPDGSGSRDVVFSMSGLNSAAPLDVTTSMSFNPMHTWAADLDVRLIAPNGAQTTIFSRTGLNTSLPNGDDSDLVGPYKFFDNNSNNWWSAATAANSGTAIPNGSYRSSNPGGPGETGTNTLITPAFAGVSNPNGTWTLQFQDVAGGDSGTVSAAELDLFERADTTAPPAPTLTGSDPASPAQSTTPRFKGSAEAGSIVRIHSDPFTCTNASVIATGTAAEFAGPGIRVPVSSGFTNYGATVMDPSGNISSGCAGPIAYDQDSDPPVAPTLSSVDPASPANNNNPKVIGTTSAGSPVTVNVYKNNGTCTGTPDATGSVATFTGAGITVAVGSDTTTALRTATVDQAGNVSGCSNVSNYVEDSTVVPPALTATGPASPANDNAPEIKGSAELGSAVKLFTTSDCSGAPAATGTEVQLAGAGIAVSVPDDSTAAIRAVATDPAGNVSGCSAPISYVEDSTALAPTLTATDPPSPANNNAPQVKGSAEAGSQVALFTTADCSGSPAATGSAAELAGTGIAVSVPDDSTTEVRGVATDPTGNLSPCSGPITYVEATPDPPPPPDTTPPETTAITAKAKVKTKGKSAKVGFALASSEPGSRFECSLDGDPFAACTPAPELKLKVGKHALDAVAIDAAGNRDRTPASVRVKVVGKRRRK
jgi:subtilisin-like proprotein convertase family protein